LPGKIEKAKGIAEAGKNIAALKEAKEGLEKELAKATSEHTVAPKVVEDTANREIESLRQTIDQQAELLHTRDAEAEKNKKAHEDATTAMHSELEQVLAKLDLVDAELKSKSSTFSSL
jgi:hypothetical protein